MPDGAQPMEPHPRPQLERTGWISLNGSWDFAIDSDAIWRTPEQVTWDRQIKVPFSPETSESGLLYTGFFKACWYRRRFHCPRIEGTERLILRFGAVDYAAAVWLNGKLAVRHEGGHTPFSADITDLLVDGLQTVVVCADDDPHDLSKPRGKQDWQLEPHSIWYPRTSGIWQTVWLEVIPEISIGYLRWTPNIELWEIGLDVRFAGPSQEGLRLGVKLWTGNTVIADDQYGLIGGELARRIVLSDPGIDDYRNELLWSPSRPTLIQA